MKFFKILIATLLLFHFGCSTSVEENTQQGPVTSSSFWGHHYSVATDLPYGDDPQQRLDVYSQGQWVGEPDYWHLDSVQHPTLIYIHGGGWVAGEKESSIPFLIPYLDRGWNVINIEYRRGDNTAPQAVDDTMCALTWVTENADQFNLNLDHVVISGGSAGGHLALITGLLNTITDSHKCYAGSEIEIKAIVNWFGITDIAKVEHYLRTTIPEWNYAGSWIESLEKVDSISNMFSPVTKVTSAAPAIITIHGQKDSVVPYDQAVALHKLLEEAGVKNELVSDPEGKHLGFSEKQFQHNYTRIFTFLDEVNE